VSAADLTKVLDSLRAAQARKQAVDLFVAAQQAAGIPSQAAAALGLVAAATGAKLDPALIKAAETEHAAAVDQQAAEATFSVARQHLASLGVALYTSSPQATFDMQLDRAGVGKAYMSILTARNMKSFAQEKTKLDAANRVLAKARDHSVQLVSMKAAAFAAQSASFDSATAGLSPQSAQSPQSPTPMSASKGNKGNKGPATATVDGSPTILGPSTLTGTELAAWFASTGKPANASVPMSELAPDYTTIGASEGVRADLAFAQSIIETGYFDFPANGQVTPADNNFAGIGACDSCSHGFPFPDAKTGVAAQLQLLHAYAAKGVPTPLIGSVSVSGCCPTWMALSGVWATGAGYGFKILSIYVRMLDWVIGVRSRGAGL
jgi:hypothetical protein